MKIDRGRGSSKVPAELVGRGGMRVAVTEQREEDQEGGGGGRGWGRQSKRLRRPTRVTTADAFPNAKRGRDAEVTNRSVPRQEQVAETERYFAKGLESSAPTVNEESEMPTVQNLSKVQRKCGVRGGEPNCMSGVKDEREQEPHGGGGRPQRERRCDSITPLGRSHQGGGEGEGVDPTMISLVLRFQSPEVEGRWFVVYPCNRGTL